MRTWDHYIVSELGQFAPARDLTPLQDYPVTVDWSLSYNQRDFYVFGVLAAETKRRWLQYPYWSCRRRPSSSLA